MCVIAFPIILDTFNIDDAAKVMVNDKVRTIRHYYVIYCAFLIRGTHPLIPSLGKRGGEPSAS